MTRGHITHIQSVVLLCAVGIVACAGKGSTSPDTTSPVELASSSESESESVTLDSLELTRDLPGTAQALYSAWIDGEQHAAFTGSPATGEPLVGSEHTAWGGYISGEILELEATHRIVMSWRTKEFPEDAADSRVELRFEDTAEGVRLTIIHTNIPPGQGPKYEQGWEEHYVQPLADYFGSESSAAPGD